MRVDGPYGRGILALDGVFELHTLLCQRPIHPLLLSLGWVKPWLTTRALQHCHRSYGENRGNDS